MATGKNFIKEYGKINTLEECAPKVEIAEPQKNDIVLDIGTGLGFTSLYLSDKVKKIIAVDSNYEHLEVAKAKAKAKKINNIEFVQMEIKEDLKWEDNTFSLVCCRAALHHLSFRDEFFKEASRILKPKGRFDIMDPIVSENFKLFWTPISRIGESDHVSYCTYFELMQLFETNEFEVKIMVPFRFIRYLNEWLSRFGNNDSSGYLNKRAFKLITEFMPSDLKHEIDLQKNKNDNWEFSYHCLEVVAYKA